MQGADHGGPRYHEMVVAHRMDDVERGEVLRRDPEGEAIDPAKSAAHERTSRIRLHDGIGGPGGRRIQGEHGCLVSAQHESIRQLIREMSDATVRSAGKKTLYDRDPHAWVRLADSCAS